MPDLTRKSGLPALLGVLCALGCVFAGSAQAISTHPFAYEFSAGPECEAADVAVHEATGDVYVLCHVSGQNLSVIRKFDSTGNPVNFTAVGPYVEGNAIIGTPNPAAEGGAGSTENTYTVNTALNVDNSGGPNDGNIFIVDGGHLQSKFADMWSPAGKWLGSITSTGANGTVAGVDIGPDGSIYLASWLADGGRIAKYNFAFHEVERVYGGLEGQLGFTDTRVDSTGAVWGLEAIAGFSTYSILKYEADQFTTNLKANLFNEDGIPASNPSPFAPTPLVGCRFPCFNGVEFGELLFLNTSFDVDLNTNDLYVNNGSSIVPYSQGVPGELAHQLQEPLGGGHLEESSGTYVALDGRIFATTKGNVLVFSKGETLPDVHSFAPQLHDLDHHSALLHGEVDPAGGKPVDECKLEWGTTTAYGNVLPCSPNPSGANFTGPTQVSTELAGLTIGTTYHYRFVAANPDGVSFGGDQQVSPVAVLDVETKPAANLTPGSEQLNGRLDPDGIPTTYHFDYGLTTEYRQRTPDASAGSGTGETPVSAEIESLQAGRTYHYRLVAENSLGTTVGEDRTFTTASAPKILGVHATELRDTSGTLEASINPAGYDTQYYFEYGSTAEYGSRVPVPDGDLGAATTPQTASTQLTDLTPGVTYHFRIVATNEWGSSASDDTTFIFSPPRCPNAHIREQTSAAYLPDCRAYELVTPAVAGSGQFFPSSLAQAFGAGFNGPSTFDLAQPIQNTGEATHPSRFLFYGGIGAVPGLNPPNAVLDTYLATRTPTGWVTTLPGLTGSETLTSGRHECDPTLSICLDHHGIDVFSGLHPEENAPYAFRADGKKLGQWPTNVSVVPGGNKFHGDQQTSADFNHFVFSSVDIPFTKDGRSSSPGSAYVNDIADRTVTLISRFPNGEDIPHGTGDKEEFITFPPHGVSRDGSHIVLETLANGGHHLYLWWNGELRRLVGEHAVKFAGMTSDGSVIYFTSQQQLTPEDTDSSVDLYRWSEATEETTLVSVGAGAGNSDTCNASWISKCSIEILHTDRDNLAGPWLSPSWPGPIELPGLDSKLATGSGDIYYYSPESLDPDSPAVPGERNLYLFRGGRNHLVATLDPGTRITRMQISPDGAHAAFITRATLTGYDTDGHLEMYTYNADTGDIRCASCNPSGAPPTANAIGSQGGPFMSNDGRAFFATREALVPQDTDEIIDVYEYVGGRPQLISSGTQTRDFSAGSVIQVFFTPQHIGLEGVSGDGNDVYFTTYDTLVKQDLNGSFVKIYDARTAGGFEIEAPLAPCAAADECHGAGSGRMATPQLPSTADLGAGSNVKGAVKKHGRHKHRRKHKHGRHHRRHPKAKAGGRHG